MDKYCSTKKIAINDYIKQNKIFGEKETTENKVPLCEYAKIKEMKFQQPGLIFRLHYTENAHNCYYQQSIRTMKFKAKYQRKVFEQIKVAKIVAIGKGTVTGCKIKKRKNYKKNISLQIETNRG